MKQVLIKRGKAILRETPVPSMNDQSILVEVGYSLISTGTEIAELQRSGQSLAQKVRARPENIKKTLDLVRTRGIRQAIETVQQKGSVERVTGYSCSGRVVKVGNKVADIKPGDLVACAGAGKANHAEFVNIPRNLLVKIPEGCSLEDAASVTLGAIAMQGVRRADIRLGEFTAVIGLGLIGQITVQILQAGGCRVIGIDIDPARIELADSLGMNYGVDASKEDPCVRVRNQTAGIGVDATIITADSTEHSILQEAMEITRKKGTVVIVGSVGLNLQRSPFYKKEIDLLISCSYGPGRYDESYEEKGRDYPLSYVRWTENRNMQAYLTLIAEQKINVGDLVQAKYPLADAGNAFQSLKQGERKPLGCLLCYNRTEKETQKTSSHTIQLQAKPLSYPIRVGLIGVGSFAIGTHLPNLRALHKQYAIHALSGRDGAKMQIVGKQYNAAYTTTDYHKILEDTDVDMVLICTRHNLHARMTVEAMQRGKSIFVEKPLATTEKDLAEIKKILQNNPHEDRLLVGFNRRFSPAAKRVKEILSKRINPAIILYRVNAGYIPLDHWVHTEEGGGRIVGECCHMLDFFRYLIGYPPVSVDVSSITPATTHISSVDNTIATIKYQDGSVCSVTYTSLGTGSVEKESIEIVCDNKVLMIHDFQSLEIHGCKEPGWKGKGPDKGHTRELVEFESYLRGRSDAPIPVEEILETTELSFLIDNMARGHATDSR